MIKNGNPKEKKTVSLFSPLTLAYIGDSVFDLIVKEHLLHDENIPNGSLHKRAKKFVSAVGQSMAVEYILPLLSEEETAIYKRGRNCEVNPNKNSDIMEYHRATGLEALIGYLYLTGQCDRLEEIVFVIFENLGDEKVESEKSSC